MVAIGRRCGVLVVLGFLALGGSTAAPLAAQVTHSREELLEVARGIIASARYCGLATLDESGQARIRTMDPFLPDADWSIWMGTRRGSRKVLDIIRDRRVTLYYSTPERGAYVSVSGRARLVEDPVERDARWKEEWEAFYPDREAQYVLIRVIPDRLEVIDYSRGIGGDPETWEPPVVRWEG